MRERIKHKKSTISGLIIIAFALFLGIGYKQWDIASGLITTGIGFIFYKPKGEHDNK